jgi:AcrR family transcriptional regulator
LLELAYAYVLAHGLASLSLRPLATAIGSSPRVLLFLFGTKDGLLRALLARARAEELELLDRLRGGGSDDRLAVVVSEVWSWLAASEHRGLLTLWVEGYAQSLVEPDGPWAGFAQATVNDWLELLADAQSPATGPGSAAQRTLALAVLRGGLLDLLATGDVERTTAALGQLLEQMAGAEPDRATRRYRKSRPHRP